jgi:hypothetical protein
LKKILECVIIKLHVFYINEQLVLSGKYNAKVLQEIYYKKLELSKKQERLKVRKAAENKTKKVGRPAKNAAKNNVVQSSAETVTPIEEVKEEVKAEEVVAEEVKAVATPETKEEKPARKTRATKTTAKKEKAPKAEKVEEEKPATKRASKSSEKITLQVDGREDLSMSTLIDRVKAAYVAEGHKSASIKNVEVYVKLSENMAYYVIDGYASGISLY